MMPKIKKLVKENIGFLLILSVSLLILLNYDARTLFINQLFRLGLFSPSTTERSIKTGDTAISETLFKDEKSNIVKLADLKGKVVFINFWATWCPPCIAEMPSIQKLFNETQGENITFLMVDIDGDHSKAKDFMLKKNYTLPVYSLASSISKDIYKGSTPTTVILDKSGQIIHHHVGLSNYGDKNFIDFITGAARN